MLKTRIAVFISGGGTNLQALIDAQNKGKINSGEIVLVVSSSSSAFGLERAKKARIKSEVVSKKACGSNEVYDKKLYELMQENNIQLIVLAGFLNVLSESFTRAYKKRIINVHPSLIPSFCGDGFYGLRVHQAALNYGVKVSGATVHFADEVVDAGQIIAQKAVYIKDDDTAETLQRRIMEQAEWILLPECVEKISREIAQKGESYEPIRNL